MISVIIPSYNREKTIEKAVRSVLEQTIDDLEVIIVDDGSTDNTETIITSIEDTRVRFLKQNHAGACEARNLGIRESRGEYIAFHDSDDCCRANRLEIEMKELLDNRVDMVCGNICMHKDNKTFLRPAYERGTIHSLNDLYGIGTMTFFAKREVFDAVPFDSEMPRWQDLEELINIYKHGFKIFFTDSVLIDYYEGKDSISRSPQKGLAAFDLIVKKHPEIKSNGKILYSRLLRHKARYKIDCGMKDYSEDYKLAYVNNKTIKNMFWVVFSKIGIAKYISKIARKVYMTE